MLISQNLQHKWNYPVKLIIYVSKSYFVNCFVKTISVITTLSCINSLKIFFCKKWENWNRHKIEIFFIVLILNINKFV